MVAQVGAYGGQRGHNHEAETGTQRENLHDAQRGGKDAH